VITLGKSRAIVFEPSILKTLHRYHDRQVRLLGVHGQDVISRLRVGIVGLGGTGSVVAQELAYLGIRNFLLIDPDTVDKTNLNRLVGAYRKHIDRPKVRVASEHIRQINPEATVSALSQSVLDADTARSLLATDFIFCCTDSQASRAVLNQLAYQYLIPTIDSGVSITTGGQKVDRIAGRIQLLSPGQACLTCQELLNANVVREEFMTPEQRAQDPYFVGVGEPQPAVVSLNGTISSLAVTMFLAVVTDLPSSARYLLYDALQGKVRPATASQYPTCIVCSKHGSLARGDQWSLPVRQVSTHEPVK
jgi:molybdopterin/thiamine biosynthesis adenylyltransferase